VVLKLDAVYTSCGAATRAAGRHPTTRALRGQAATGSMEPALQSCC
jgi:hypothetical protein